MGTALDAYRIIVRGRNKAFSLSVASSFAEFGPRSVLHLPTKVVGSERISIGAHVMVGPGSWLETQGSGRIVLGDGVKMVGSVTIASHVEVVIEPQVLFARGVYVSDFSHARADRVTPIVAQGVTDQAPVRICKGAWLGQNAVVLPGVTIGRNAVVGANSVVTRDVPDFQVAVGAPARLVGTTDRGAAEPA